MRIENLYAELGEAIKACRETAGLTQSDLAKLVGLSRASIANIETGRQKVFLHQLYSVATHLNVGVADLLPKQSSFDNGLPTDLSREQKYWAESVLASFVSQPPEGEVNPSLVSTSELKGEQREWAELVIRTANG